MHGFVIKYLDFSFIKETNYKNIKLRKRAKYFDVFMDPLPKTKKCVKKPYSLIIGTNSENEKIGAFLYTRD